MSSPSNQRGLSILLCLGLALAIVAGTYAVYARIADSIADYGRREYARGKADQIALQDAADKAAANKDKHDQAGDRKLVADEVKAGQVASGTAAKSNTQWKENRNEARRNGVSLAVSEPTLPEVEVVAYADDDGAPVGTGVRHPGSGIRFTWGFVRQFDAAWTGLTGQPVFGDRPRAADGTEFADAAASPYGPDDVLDNRGENARSCSDDRRTLARLISTIDALEAKWDREHTEASP